MRNKAIYAIVVIYLASTCICWWSTRACQQEVKLWESDGDEYDENRSWQMIIKSSSSLDTLSNRLFVAKHTQIYLRFVLRPTKIAHHSLVSTKTLSGICTSTIALHCKNWDRIQYRQKSARIYYSKETLCDHSNACNECKAWCTVRKNAWEANISNSNCSCAIFERVFTIDSILL